MNNFLKKYFPIILLCCAFFILGAITQMESGKKPVTQDVIKNAEKLIGLNFSDAKIDSMTDNLNGNISSYENLRKVLLPNNIPPALLFNPVPVGMKIVKDQKPVIFSSYENTVLPENNEELAYYSIGQLAELIRTKKITSLQLTKLYIERLKKYGPKLECIVTMTEELALKDARTADDEIAAGKYKGLLHGIPFGIKDLLSTKDYKTTWGSPVYKEQLIDEDAAVVKKLKDAGAVLLVKLSLGEIANGDVWFGGKTKNPWDYSKGSGGSSAGPGAAVSAGLIPFAIGSETWGSIIDPSTLCGITGLRPTFGRISRKGAMTLAWSMDKLGPMCRNIEDCAIVLNAIYGPDGEDQTVIDAAFNYTPDIDLNGLKIGYVKNDFDSSVFKAFSVVTFKVLESMGAKLVPIELPAFPIRDMSFILDAETGAAFDEFVRSGKEDHMVLQDKNSWPNIFRSSRFITAVEYIQANRIRYEVIQEMTKIFEKVDIYIAPSLEGDNLLLTNLTGHPCVCVPNGFSKEGTPVSISFIGNLFGEAELLAIAKKYQDATEFHKKHPLLRE